MADPENSLVASNPGTIPLLTDSRLRVEVPGGPVSSETAIWEASSPLGTRMLPMKRTYLDYPMRSRRSCINGGLDRR